MTCGVKDSEPWFMPISLFTFNSIGERGFVGTRPRPIQDFYDELFSGSSRSLADHVCNSAASFDSDGTSFYNLSLETAYVPSIPPTGQARLGSGAYKNSRQYYENAFFVP